ncbi:hypothetical protein J2T12_003599 [Paenibacillus anaericanus]|nr:hypothetical protein [Paenibacillus anaericanus]MDQ0090185.1 hypothetical protein [Paenibacillus anaericanus]
MAYYALHKLHIMPWDFAELEPRKKAAIIAMIQVRIKAEAKMAKK